MPDTIEKITFSDEVIDELIELTKAGKITWCEITRNYYSQLNDMSLYFYESYMNQETQSKVVKLNIGNKHMKETLYSYREEKSCKLVQLGNTIRQSFKTSESKTNQEILDKLRSS